MLMIEGAERTRARPSAALEPVRFRERVEYGLVRGFVAVLGSLPRRAAEWTGTVVARLAYCVAGRLRRVARRNLELAFPDWSREERARVLRESFRSLGRQLAEFARMPRYTRQSAADLIGYEGLERYLKARDHGRGVLVLTAHLGAWELSSFFHSLMGYAMGMVIRRLDNPLVDRFVNEIRCQHGNWVLHKSEFARALLTEMRAGRTVGILMDTNMTPPQGVFVPFFGVPACTASGLARVALRTGAAVLPGFLLWEAEERRWVLHFGDEIALVRTGDAEADAAANTARFTQVLESWIRRYPEQWLWMHRRWKTRPVGEPGIY